MVQTWVGGTCQAGPEHAEPPSYAVKHVERIAPDADLEQAGADAADAVKSRAGEAGLHSAANGIDPRTWELVTFALHARRPAEAGAELYQVLHLSAPESGDLPSALRKRLFVR